MTSRPQQLSTLINAVYDDAESGMWKRSGTCANPGEVARLLSNQALILAEIDGMLVGAVNVNLMTDGTGEFGMLVADRNQHREGIGSALVVHAEHWGRDMGCHTPQLDSPEQEVLEAVVLQDRVYAAGYGTLRDTPS